MAEFVQPLPALRCAARRKLAKRIRQHLTATYGASHDVTVGFLRAVDGYTDAQLQSIAREHGVNL